MKQNYTKEQIMKDLDNILQIIESDNAADSRELSEFNEGRIDARDGIYWLISNMQEKLFKDLNK